MAEEKWYDKKITLGDVKKGLGKVGVSFGNKQTITDMNPERYHTKEELKQGKVCFEDDIFKVEKPIKSIDPHPDTFKDPDWMTRSAKPKHEDLPGICGIKSESERIYNGRKISEKNWRMLKDIEDTMTGFKNMMDVNNSRDFRYYKEEEEEQLGFSKYDSYDSVNDGEGLEKTMNFVVNVFRLIGVGLVTLVILGLIF